MKFIQGLKRIRVFDKNDSEHGTKFWASHWLLEETDEYFVCLTHHSIRSLEINTYTKEKFKYTIEYNE